MGAQNLLSRRALLGALAATSAAVSLPAVAAPAIPSPLEELIADYVWRKAEADETDATANAAEELFEDRHPIPVVHHGRRAISDPVTRLPAVNSKGEVVAWTTWQFSYEHEINAHFRQCREDSPPNYWTESQKVHQRQLRDALLSDLDALWSARQERRQIEGVEALNDAADEAGKAMAAARYAVLQYRPATMDEVAIKNRFVVTLFRGRSIDGDELAAIYCPDEEGAQADG